MAKTTKVAVRGTPKKQRGPLNNFMVGVGQVLDLGATIAPPKQELSYSAYDKAIRSHWAQSGCYMNQAMREVKR